MPCALLSVYEQEHTHDDNNSNIADKLVSTSSVSTALSTHVRKRKYNAVIEKENNNSSSSNNTNISSDIDIYGTDSAEEFSLFQEDSSPLTKKKKQQQQHRQHAAAADGGAHSDVYSSSEDTSWLDSLWGDFPYN